MIKLTWLTALALAMVVAVSSTLHAQTLQTGTWTGTAVGPDGSSEDVTFEVRAVPVWTRDGTRVVLAPPGSRVAASQLTITYYSRRGLIPLRDIRLEGDTFSYEFSVGGGLDVTCSLTRQEDGSYTGPCGVGGGQGGRHTMRPPTG